MLGCRLAEIASKRDTGCTDARPLRGADGTCRRDDFGNVGVASLMGLPELDKNVDSATDSNIS